MPLEHLLAPGTVDVLRTAGLHKIAGAMYGVDEMTGPQAARLIGERAYLRRKTARLVTAGLLSLAVVTEKTALAPETVALLRRAVAPGTKGI